MGEFLKRLHLAIIVLLFGDLRNGNLEHLKSLLSEVDYIATHYNDLSKQEIVNLITGDQNKSSTGMRHHLAHIISTSQNWRIVNAEMVESELIDAKRRVVKRLGRMRVKDGRKSKKT